MRGCPVSRLAQVCGGVQAEGIDADAAAYLRSVRKEAAKLPRVSVGTRLNPQGPSGSSSHLASPRTPMPPYEWICTVVDNFVTARTQVQRDIETHTPVEAGQALPSLGNRGAWNELVHSESAQPFSSTLARLDNTLAVWCLQSLIESSRQKAELQPHLAIWMYGLMVRLEKPVHPNVAAVLRDVHVFAAERRRRLPDACSSAESEDAAEVAMYDTLRVLAGGYFGQDRDMAPVVNEYLLRTDRV
jgi:hypothetical protein